MASPQVNVDPSQKRNPLLLHLRQRVLTAFWANGKSHFNNKNIYKLKFRSGIISFL